MTHALLIVSLAWGAFAFGAVYPWAYWPLATLLSVVGIAGVLVRGKDFPRQWGLAAAFGVFLVAGLVQLVPVSNTVLSAVSPETPRTIAQLDLEFAAGAVERHAPSIAPALTLVGLALFTSNAMLVIGCIRLFSIAGSRRVAGAVSILGLALSLAGIIQSGVFNGKIYGFWTPLQVGNPFGPFVNRNHYAGWMLMALPLTLGLLCSGIAQSMRGVNPTWRDRFIWLSTPEANRLILLAAGAIVMALSVVMTMSRSAISALGLALVVTGGFAARRQKRQGGTVSIAYFLVLIAVAIAWAGTDGIASRFGQANWADFNDRRGAWADAIDIASKFPLTGSGLNTYGVATLIYQRHDLSQHYAQAHNDLLQLAAEGGLLLTIPAGVCVGLLIVGVRRRFLDESSTGTYWLRLGASTALIAIALQEMVDFSLQMPGNAALFSVVCAIALHTTPPPHSPSSKLRIS